MERWWSPEHLLLSSLGLTLIVLHVSVACAAEDVENVQDTLLRAKQHCLVANALKVPVHLTVDVTASQARPIVAV